MLNIPLSLAINICILPAAAYIFKDRQIDRQIDRQMDGWIDRYRYIDIDINMDKRYQQQPPINILPLHSVPLVDLNLHIQMAL